MKVYDQEDTIAAISTPAGEGGIGIIRISGPQSLASALKLFKPQIKKTVYQSHRLYLGEIISPSDGKTIDECLFTYMKSPNSFTREDVVEFHCHGGTVVLQMVMEHLLRTGVRDAAPGEFTKRAFLNGRIDLSQAEAVIDIIRAKTDRSLRVAQSQLKGGLKDTLKAVRDLLIQALALTEAFIDFPEEDIDPASFCDIDKTIGQALDIIQGLTDTYEEGRIIREGVHVVIAGRPNVGKSSLLNALLREKRAIVTSVPGTTRDVIEEVINIKGIPVNLIDTAGIRDTVDIVEEEGIRRTIDKLGQADIVLYMVDEEGIHKSDTDFLDSLDSGRKILVINKTDLMTSGEIEKIKTLAPATHAVSLSVFQEEGIEALKNALYETLLHHGHGLSPQVVISRKRHKVALEEAGHLLLSARQGLIEQRPCELISIDMREALDKIGEVAGDTTPEHILNKIFSDFCIGK